MPTRFEYGDSVVAIAVGATIFKPLDQILGETGGIVFVSVLCTGDDDSVLSPKRPDERPAGGSRIDDGDTS
jgi:hypothetical protein